MSSLRRRSSQRFLDPRLLLDRGARGTVVLVEREPLELELGLALLGLAFQAQDQV